MYGILTMISMIGWGNAKVCELCGRLFVDNPS